MDCVMIETLIASIARDGRAAVPVTELAGAIGWPVERVCDVGAEAEEAGWLESWAENPAGPSLTLSSLLVEQLGLELDADNSRWCRLGTAGPGRSARTDGTIITETDYLTADGEGSPLERRIDHRSPDPSAIMDTPEPPRKPPRAPRTPSGRPRPILYLGVNLIWVGPVAGSSCPVCMGRRLRWFEYCLWCDRWGLDHLYPAAWGTGARVRYEAGKLKGGLG